MFTARQRCQQHRLAEGFGRLQQQELTSMNA